MSVLQLCILFHVEIVLFILVVLAIRNINSRRCRLRRRHMEDEENESAARNDRESLREENVLLKRLLAGHDIKEIITQELDNVPPYMKYAPPQKTK